MRAKVRLSRDAKILWNMLSNYKWRKRIWKILHPVEQFRHLWQCMSHSISPYLYMVQLEENWKRSLLKGSTRCPMGDRSASFICRLVRTCKAETTDWVKVIREKLLAFYPSALWKKILLTIGSLCDSLIQKALDWLGQVQAKTKELIAGPF